MRLRSRHLRFPRCQHRVCHLGGRTPAALLLLLLRLLFLLLRRRLFFLGVLLGRLLLALLLLCLSSLCFLIGLACGHVSGTDASLVLIQIKINLGASRQLGTITHIA